MTNLINKILAIFQLKLVSTKPVNLVDETVKFLNTIPKSDLLDPNMSGYVGDVNYVQEMVKGEFPQVSGTTYVHHIVGKEVKYYNYEGDNYTPEELQEKLK